MQRQRTNSDDEELTAAARELAAIIAAAGEIDQFAPVFTPFVTVAVNFWVCAELRGTAPGATLSDKGG